MVQLGTGDRSPPARLTACGPSTTRGCAPRCSRSGSRRASVQDHGHSRTAHGREISPHRADQPLHEWVTGAHACGLNFVDLQNPKVRRPPVRLEQRIVIGAEMSGDALPVNGSIKHAADVCARGAPQFTPIVLPFTAGEVNLVMQPGPSGHAAVSYCSMESQLATRAERTSVRRHRAHRPLGDDSPGRPSAAATARAVAFFERPRGARVCVHIRSLRKTEPGCCRRLADRSSQSQSTLVCSPWVVSSGVAQSNSSDDQVAAMKRSVRIDGIAMAGGSIAFALLHLPRLPQRPPQSSSPRSPPGIGTGS
ncbi:MAG: hypothetical protein Udaeo2_32080 [Candidatus Udaeobacter sp.]|nr:MAG: hypothetical protein Udaeo2_32080 [Candidatus Udaeobacter sp.]